VTELPTIRVDASGYRYGGESVDGFADRTDLPDTAREVIAAMARSVTPESLSDVQRALLRQRDERSAADVWLSLVTRDADLVAAADERGDLRSLSETDYDLWRYPQDHPSLPDDARYPLTIGHAATLAGVTQVVLRRWADAGLVPAIRVGERFYFFSAGVLQALLLAKRDRYEISALLKLVRGGDDSAEWARMIGRTLEVMAQAAALQDATAQAASDLERIGDQLVRSSDSFAHINMAELQAPADVPADAFRRVVAARRAG
jgi:DNA-binding transcriptional MerR regulator